MHSKLNMKHTWLLTGPPHTHTSLITPLYLPLLLIHTPPRCSGHYRGGGCCRWHSSCGKDLGGGPSEPPVKQASDTAVSQPYPNTHHRGARGGGRSVWFSPSSPLQSVLHGWVLVAWWLSAEMQQVPGSIASFRVHSALPQKLRRRVFQSEHFILFCWSRGDPR